MGTSVSCDIYNKLGQKGKHKNNKCRKRQKTNIAALELAVEKRRTAVLARKAEEERDTEEQASRLAVNLL